MDNLNPLKPDFSQAIASTNSVEELIRKYRIVCMALNIAAEYEDMRLSRETATECDAETVAMVRDTWLEQAQQRLALADVPTPEHKN